MKVVDLSIVMKTFTIREGESQNLKTSHRPKMGGHLDSSQISRAMAAKPQLGRWLGADQVSNDENGRHKLKARSPLPERGRMLEKYEKILEKDFWFRTL